jgi:alpha-D-ribose 1-methylphosphonate 5-triphosphate synthase subunit PhnH
VLNKFHQQDKGLKPLVLWDILDKCCIASPKPMTQTIDQKTTLCDRDLNLWLEDAIAKQVSNLNFGTSL